MTPEQKLDSVTQSLGLLKTLCGENLELLPKPYKVMLAETIVAIHRDKLKGYSFVADIDEDDLEELGNNLTKDDLEELKVFFDRDKKVYLLSPVEIVNRWYGLDLCGINISLLNDRVVGRWRKKYDHCTKIRPCRDNDKATYLYYSFDWDIVGEVLEEMGIKVA